MREDGAHATSKARSLARLVPASCDDGDFSVEVTPASDLTRAHPGAWLVQGWVAGTDACAQADFRIVP